MLSHEIHLDSDRFPYIVQSRVFVAHCSLQVLLVHELDQFLLVLDYHLRGQADVLHDGLLQRACDLLDAD
jgi:hypothetical protein